MSLLGIVDELFRQAGNPPRRLVESIQIGMDRYGNALLSRAVGGDLLFGLAVSFGQTSQIMRRIVQDDIGVRVPSQDPPTMRDDDL